MRASIPFAASRSCIRPGSKARCNSSIAREALSEIFAPPRQLHDRRLENGFGSEVTEVRDEAAPDPGLQEREEQVHCPLVIFQLGATSDS
jgi:hypothetical protein